MFILYSGLGGKQVGNKLLQLLLSLSTLLPCSGISLLFFELNFYISDYVKFHALLSDFLIVFSFLIIKTYKTRIRCLSSGLHVCNTCHWNFRLYYNLPNAHPMLIKIACMKYSPLDFQIVLQLTKCASNAYQNCMHEILATGLSCFITTYQMRIQYLSKLHA